MDRIFTATKTAIGLFKSSLWFLSTHPGKSWGNPSRQLAVLTRRHHRRIIMLDLDCRLVNPIFVPQNFGAISKYVGPSHCWS